MGEVVREFRKRRAAQLYALGCDLDEDPGRQADAAAAYERALALDPELANAWTNLGNVLYRAGDGREAEKMYRRAIELAPRQAEARYNLGYSMLERGLPDSAAACLREAVECDPGFADAWFNLAAALEACSRFRDALEAWKRYLDLRPGDGEWEARARERAAACERRAR